MTKYLVVAKYYQTIDNFCIVEAESEDEAKQKAAVMMYKSVYNCFVFNVEEMEDDWMYYKM